MKLFITHGGYNSLLETFQAGVPMITIALFADQYGNAVRAERLGVSVNVDKATIDNVTVANAMETILRNNSYSLKAKKLAEILKDRIRPNEELVVYQIERTLRNFDHLPRLRSAMKMNSLQYHSLDTGFVLLCIPLSAVTLIVLCLIRIWRVVQKQS